MSEKRGKLKAKKLIQVKQWLKFWHFSIVFILIVLSVFGTIKPVFEVFAGVPKIISYQGRLADSSGNLLGSSLGTDYYFKFSIWTTDGVSATGTKVWPASDPGITTSTVISGVFNVNIGDTSNGYPDALDFDFYSNTDVFLRVEVSASGSSFESLLPRQRIAASGFAINTDTVSGKLRASSTADYTFDVINDGSGRANLQTEGMIRVGNFSSAPTTLGGGSLYYDTANNNLFVWNTASSTWVSLGGGAAGASTLQDAYNLGNTITTANARDISFTLANTATDSNFVINIAGTSTGVFQIQASTTPVFSISQTNVTSTAVLNWTIQGTANLATTTINGLLTANNISSTNATISGGSINSTPIGSSSASTAIFTNATTTGTFTAQGNVSLATTTVSSLTATIATTTRLFVITSSTLGTVVSGIWQGTAIEDSFISSAVTWNAKENALTFNSPLSRSGNIISIPVATNATSGYLSSTDWNTFNDKLSTSTGLVVANFATSSISQWNNNSGYLTSLSGALLIANNLSDLNNTSTARTNIGLGNVLNSLQLVASNNLSDLTNTSTARTNLGLGTSAVQNVGYFLQTANNLSDITNTSTARTNLGLGSIATFASTDYLTSSTAYVATSRNINTTAPLAGGGNLSADRTLSLTTSTFLMKADNLSELASTSTARTNLGLTDTATLASSTWLKTANNGSDINSTSTFRTNLGLGTAAVQNVGYFLQTANNLSDITNTSTARTNIGLGNVLNSLQLVASNNLSDLTNTSTARTNIGLGNVLNSLQLVASNNLSDLTNTSTARTNLGLGTAAVQNVGYFLQTANNLSDLNATSTARTNLLGTPTEQGQLVMASGTSQWVLGKLVAGSNVTITTSTPGQITIASTGGSGSVSTSSAITQYNFPYWANTTGGLSGTSTLSISGTNLLQNGGSFTVQGGNLVVGGTATSTITGDGTASIIGGDLNISGTSTITGSLRVGANTDNSILVGNGTIFQLKALPDCSPTTGKLHYTSSTNTWSCESDAGAGGGAPVDPSYITLGLNATLTNERVATTTSPITFIDGGANGNLTFKIQDASSQGQLLMASGTTHWVIGDLVSGSNITITTSTPGQITIASTGGGTPGGSSTQVQYNESGSFAGDTNFTWTSSTQLLTVASTTVSGTLKIASLSGLLKATTGAVGTAIQGTDYGIINNIAGISTSTITFTTGTSGTDFNISTTTNSITWNIPSSSGSNRGLLTSTDWNTFNDKLSTSTGLTTANFATTSISQWNNNSGYITTSTGLTTSNFATTSISQWNNNSNYITLFSLSASNPITYNTSTGAIGWTNSNNYISSSTGNGLYLQIANNLSDLTNISTARTNLGLGTAAVQNVGYFLQTANNLSDITNTSTARTNLGLGSIATFASTDYLTSSTAYVATSRNINTTAPLAGGGNLSADRTLSITTSTFLMKADNLSELASTSTARTNLGLTDTATLASSTWLKTANNGSDINSTSTFRTNLGLGTAAVQNVGYFLQTANNLSDITNTSTARTNLGLGDSATLASSTWLKVANNLSDLNNTSTARTNIGYSAGTNITLSAAGVITVTSTPSFTSLSLTNPLTAANGGTGTSTYIYGVVIASGTDAFSTVIPSTTGNVLTSNGSGWISQAPAPSGIQSLNGSTSSTQTFATSSADANLRLSITTANGTHTFNPQWNGTLGIDRGGLGTSTIPSNGQIPIGNGINYTIANLTQGTNAVITNAAGSITVAVTSTPVFTTATIGNVLYNSSNITPAAGFTIGDLNQTLTLQGSTTTIIATSSNAIVLTTGGSERMRINSAGNVLINTTATTTGQLNVVGTASGGSLVTVAGIYQESLLNPSAGGNYQFGNRHIVTVNPTASSSMIGELVRTIDNTSLANTVRAAEFQAWSGINTQGINTGLYSAGRTFGVQAVSNGTAGGVVQPAAIYGELTGSSTESQVMRLYSKDIASSTQDFAQFYQEVSSFGGTGLKMDFARSGSFTGNFIQLLYNQATKFAINATGTVMIGTSTPYNVSNLVVCAQSNCTLPATTSTVAVFASTDGTTSGSSISAHGSITGGVADIGEYVSVVGKAEDYEAGDLLSVATSASLMFEKSSIPYDPFLTGIVTKSSAFIAGGEIADKDNSVIMALAGRVLLKVSNESGAIKSGDLITASSKPGVGMKAKKPGRVIGIALESFEASSTDAVSKIMVFVNPHWTYPTDIEMLQGGESGNMEINNFTFSTSSVMTIAELRADKIYVKSLTVGSKEHPTGITMFDVKTRQPQCLVIEGSMPKVYAGACEENVFEPMITISVPINQDASPPQEIISDQTNSSTTEEAARSTTETATTTEINNSSTSSDQTSTSTQSTNAESNETSSSTQNDTISETTISEPATTPEPAPEPTPEPAPAPTPEPTSVSEPISAPISEPASTSTPDSEPAQLPLQ